MTAEGQLKDDRGAYRPGLSAALRAAIIVTATAAFFVIATRHIDLPGLYYDEALFYPPAAKLYADCGIQAGPDQTGDPRTFARLMVDPHYDRRWSRVAAHANKHPQQGSRHGPIEN
jgi:hypothetical protein